MNGETYSVVLDSCSTINAVSEEAASRMGYVRIKDPISISTVGPSLESTEAVEMTITIGDIHTKIKAHILPNPPADVLLGEGFLKEYSKGYQIMIQEFKMKNEGSSSGTVCSMETMKKLE